MKDKETLTLHPDSMSPGTDAIRHVIGPLLGDYAGYGPPPAAHRDIYESPPSWNRQPGRHFAFS